MKSLTRRRFVSLLSAPLAIAATRAAEEPGIGEAEFVQIGGIPQWVAIRGRDRSRPAVLFLHGGPAEAQSPYLSLFEPWERKYAVAQWDQRGAGKTFGRNGTATPDVNLARMSRDVVEVSRYVLDRLGARQLVLVGHSWGAILGMQALPLAPNLFHAFVGTGQPVSWKESVEGMRAISIARARAAGNAQAVSELEGLDPLEPANMRQLGVILKWRQMLSTPSDERYLQIQRTFTGTPGVPPSDDAKSWIAGSSFSTPLLLPEILKFDARAAGYQMPVPYFVIQGRDDNAAPPDAAQDFVDHVVAPAKGFTLIDGGHFACFTNPDGFLDALERNLNQVAH